MLVRWTKQYIHVGELEIPDDLSEEKKRQLAKDASEGFEPDRIDWVCTDYTIVDESDNEREWFDLP